MLAARKQKDRARAGDLDLARALDLDLARARAVEGYSNEEVTRFLRWYVRYVALLVAADLQFLLEQVQSQQKWWQREEDVVKTIQASLDEYLDLYIDFAILEERIEGNLPAFEGIRIVRERVRAEG